MKEPKQFLASEIQTQKRYRQNQGLQYYFLIDATAGTPAERLGHRTTENPTHEWYTTKHKIVIWQSLLYAHSIKLQQRTPTEQQCLHSALCERPQQIHVYTTDIKHDSCCNACQISSNLNLEGIKIPFTQHQQLSSILLNTKEGVETGIQLKFLRPQA